MSDNMALLGFIFFDPYMWLAIPGILLALWAQTRLSSTYNHYSRIGTARGMTGAQAARILLDRNGCANVEVFAVEGRLTDHYDPGKRAVFLSAENYHSTSIAAVGVAAHEVGHALQHRQQYGPLAMRMAMVGVTSFASRAAFLAILGGMIFGAMGLLGGELSRLLMIGGVGLFGVMFVFQIVTLPVEYDASRRAKDQLLRLGMIGEAEAPHVSKMLNAAALTYVAAAVVSLLELLRMLLWVRGMNDDR